MKKTFLLLLPVLMLSGCSLFSSDVTVEYDYENEELFTIGDLATEESIKNISVDYVNGTINIVPTTEATFKATEVTSEEVTDDVKMRYLVSDETLYIEPVQSGERKYGKAERTLTIEVPTTYTLDSIYLDTMSSDINLSVDATNLTFNTLSGTGKLSLSNFTKVDFDTVSMNTTITLTSNIGVDVLFNSTEGTLYNRVSATDANHLIEFDSVTADLTIKRA